MSTYRRRTRGYVLVYLLIRGTRIYLRGDVFVLRDPKDLLRRIGQQVGATVLLSDLEVLLRSKARHAIAWIVLRRPYSSSTIGFWISYTPADVLDYSLSPWRVNTVTPRTVSPSTGAIAPLTARKASFEEMATIVLLESEFDSARPGDSSCRLRFDVRTMVKARATATPRRTSRKLKIVTEKGNPLSRVFAT